MRSSSSPAATTCRPGPGANDNGSGTGALVELARTLVGSVTQTSLVFASVDGTTAESAGARELARHPPGGLALRAGHRAARRSAAPAARSSCGSPARAPPARRGLAAHRRAGAARRGRDGSAAALARPAGRRARRAGRPRRSGRARRPRRRRRRARRLAARRELRRRHCTDQALGRLCSGASARPPSWPRWRSTPGRGRRAWARPTSSRATACCAAGRSSCSSWRC